MFYDNLVRQVSQQGIDIREESMRGNIKGLYADNVIWINRNLLTTEKTCVVAEELGHYHTSDGDILDQMDIRNRKQEYQARRWAYKFLVSFKRIIQAYHAGVSGRHELAEYLNVTEEFLQEAIDQYKHKYGLCVTYEQYTIYFDPLGVVTSFDLPNSSALSGRGWPFI